MTTSLRQRRLLLFAGISIGVLALDRFVITPLITHWQSASAEITTLQRQLQSGRGALAISDRARDRWVELQETTLPAEVAQAEQVLLSHLNFWGEEVGVDIGSVKPQWKRGATSKAYSTLECRIDATGSVLAVTRFLHAIETSPLALRMESAEFTSRDERGQKISAAFVVSGLRLKPLEVRP
jgi:hypothetical protein